MNAQEKDPTGEPEPAPLSTTSDGSSGLLDELLLDALLPEESSPFDPTTEDRPMLYLKLVDANFAPRIDFPFEISGDGLCETRSGVTDGYGEILIEDCGPGVYELVAGGQRRLVHTLLQRDLEQDGSAYRVVIQSSAQA